LAISTSTPVHRLVTLEKISVRPTKGQLEDLVKEVQSRALKEERTLALTLTKKDAEDLSQYLTKEGIKTDFIHSGLKTHERSDVLNALQAGRIDCLVGVNVLREGLDLPQVSLVAILGADVEGFLRSETALLQMVGRAARNVNGMSIFYADTTTNSMQKCIDGTASRRELQLEYNKKHGKRMRSTAGSSTLSIFEILKDDIQVEQQAIDAFSLNKYDAD
jgi:excinuclease ABC subunit B